MKRSDPAPEGQQQSFFTPAIVWIIATLVMYICINSAWPYAFSRFFTAGYLK